MATFKAALAICCLLLVIATSGTGTIHRAKNAKKATTGARPLPLDNPGPSPEDMIPSGHSTETWVYATISAMLVGLSGIFPLLVIPIEAGKALRKGGKFDLNLKQMPN